MLIGREKKKNDNLDTYEKELLKNYEKKIIEKTILMMAKENRRNKMTKQRKKLVITLMIIKENRLDTMIKIKA